MAKEKIEFDVIGRDAGGSKAFKDVGDAAEKAGDQIDDLGKTSVDTGDKVEESGGKAEKAAKDYHGLTAEIAKTKAEMLRLANEINKTGNMDLLKDLRGQQRELRKLTGTLKIIEDAGKELAQAGAQAGKETGKTFAASVQGALSTPLLGPIITGALVAGATAAAPLVGAALGGGLLAGAGAAAAGGGLIGAWLGNPTKYAAEWQESIDRLQGRWMRASEAFAGPLEDSLREVDRVIRDLPVERLAAASKDFVGPLVQGAGTGLTEVAEGFTDLVEAAQPVVDEIGPELAGLGRDVGDALRAIGMGADGGAEGLGDLINVIGYATKAAGVFVMGLEKAYLAEKRIVTGAYEAATAIPKFGVAIEAGTQLLFHLDSSAFTAARRLDNLGREGASAFYSIDQRERDALATQQRLNQAWDDARNKILNLSNANIDVAEDFARLNEEFTRGKDALNLATEAGRDNNRLINATIDDLIRQRDAAIAAGNGSAEATAAANAEYDRQLQRLEDLLAKLLGSREAARNLMAEFKNKEITVTVKVKTVKVSAEGVVEGGDPRRNVGGAYAEGGLVRGPGTGTSDDVVRRVSNGEFVVRAAAVSALGVDFLERVNQADRNPGALAASSGRGASSGSRAGVDGRDAARMIGDEVARALSRMTFKIDDRHGRFVDLYRREG